MVGYSNDESIKGLDQRLFKPFCNSDDIMKMHNRADFFAGHCQGPILKKHNKQLQRIWEILINAVA